ncbi:MAG: SUMF1/EgtB/PvdO family nonheme iron enzyme, partial [Proteobacteria bacterium]|nr:SUMF1/EgtB/PvdO family nonheme iron enzyme [Pseudomonadota bacterium]
TLRLAVLNACEGARISQADPYAGVATSLIKQGVPAVIAMQFEITDTAALAFADELYSALVDGLPVDAAVADARTAIYALPSDIEWGTPVLYMRAKDGVLFDAVESAEPVGQGRSEKETGTTAQPPSRPRRPAAQPEVRQNQSLGIVHIALADVTPMRFVGLTGGTFTMGNPVSEKGRSGDETEHEVTVLGFEIAEAVVTQKQWQAVMGSNPSYQFENSGNSDEHPVQSISWYDAIEFANKLSRREGLPECYEVDGTNVTLRGSCTGYRLPTEAEWEYACRAGSQTAYGRGVDESALSEYAWYGKLWEKGTVAVKSLKPNAWGLYGMHGNVWEWVWDRYASYPDSAQSDPHGPSDDDALLMNIDDTKSRVLRGGAFLNGAEVLRCALRFRGGPGDRFRYNGLRVVRRARRQP